MANKNNLCFDIEGNLCLGSTSNPLSISNMVFSFKSAGDNPVISLPISDFINWLAKSLIPGFKQEDLPQSLQQLTVLLSVLEIDGTGQIMISVNVGKEVKGKWSSVWKPINGLDFSISDIGLDVLRKKTG